jgi:DNA polymerase (family X)
MMDNYAIADQFSLLAKLMDIHGDNPFKAKSYAAAAFAIEKLPVQLSATAAEKIASFKGIGDSAAKKITELLQTNQLGALNDLLAKTPQGIIDMLQIKGIGPKKIATIWKEMGLESLGELLYACNENRLMMYKGFGEKTQESVKQAIQFYMQHQGHFLYAEILPYARQIEKLLQQNFPKNPTQLSGELLQQKNIITRVQLLTTIPAAELTGFFDQNKFTVAVENNTLIAAGAEGIQLHFEQSNAENFVTQLFISSCSAEFLQELAIAVKFSANENFTDEKALFAFYDLQPIAPNQRENPAIIQQAIQKSIPPVIQVADIKAIIHSHSNWSDGSHSLEKMAEACISKGFEYLVISDHSRSAFYANGLSPERIAEQHLLIDELNKKLSPFKIFKSIECDILNDGSLDYEDAVLNSFDLVIASVHSNLKMNEEKAMARLLKAIAHPATTILGHMTGRLLLSRPGYPVNHHTIIDACVQHQVAIEINAHPRRLDMDYSFIPYAIEKGCLLSIDPDAHQVEGYNDILYGVISAQKGLLTASNNLSSYNLAQFETYLQQQAKKKH